ncbi:unnamed protein product [Lactuca saligna]|uniref:Uncharacterized protein n=1 Tax=Lactuca saligna TaxID=75948 RepID=A0AA35Z2M4_LACSI|nr:unnamed protein product [Lactuca saligna]
MALSGLVKSPVWNVLHLVHELAKSIRVFFNEKKGLMDWDDVLPEKTKKKKETSQFNYDSPSRFTERRERETRNTNSPIQQIFPTLKTSHHQSGVFERKLARNVMRNEG